MKTKIIYTNFGIASRIGDKIYINIKIKEKYPKLYKQILLHEKSHSSGFNFRDFLIDLNGKHLSSVKKEYWTFVLSNPNSLVQFFPIWIYEGEIIFDPVIIIVWLIFIGVLLWSIL